MIDNLRYKIATKLLWFASVVLPIEASISMEKYHHDNPSDDDNNLTIRQTQINTVNSSQTIIGDEVE